MMSNKLTRWIKLCVTAFLLMYAGLATAATPQVGKTYYTQHNFKFEKGRHLTTNYWRGQLIPINSKAKLISLGGKRMVLEVNGQTITFVNVPKHSQRSIEEIADNLLSSKKTSISKKFANDIKFGNLRLGMTKKQVIQTRGYPPRHRTPSTESDLWVYWSSRFVQRSLAFANGKLIKGRGLR